MTLNILLSMCYVETLWHLVDRIFPACSLPGCRTVCESQKTAQEKQPNVCTDPPVLKPHLLRVVVIQISDGSLRLLAVNVGARFIRKGQHLKLLRPVL